MRRFLLGLSLTLFSAGALLWAFNGSRFRRDAGKSHQTEATSPRVAVHSPARPADRPSSAIVREYGQLPMAFEPNVGQTNPKAKFLARGADYEAFLTRSGVVLLLHHQSQAKSKKHFAENTALSMNLEGASATKLAGVGELPGKSNYLIGRNRAKWHTDIPNYRKVRAASVYPGVDLVYYGTQDQLEYDFSLVPGANPRQIRLHVSGARRLRVDKSGNLMLQVAGGSVQLHRPIAYQEEGGRKQSVSVGYTLAGPRTVALRLGKYDRSQKLVIDPVLTYSTYLGGSGIDGANAIAVASDDTAFIAGGTFSTNFPTAHPLQPNTGGPYDFPQDAFVSKISADGSTLLYSTYLGGSATDVAHGIAVDPLGNAYVTGTTDSTDFPVTFLVAFPNCGSDGACGATLNPNKLIVENGFVSKLNIAGSGLDYSTYIGLDQHVSCNAIAVDSNGIAYVAGQTTEAFVGSSFIGASGYQPTYGGNTDGFLIALSATASSLQYSTYLGGSGEDVAYGVATDGNGDAFVTGLTYSSNYPVTSATAFDSSYGGAGDAFLTEINTAQTGSASLLYSTYIGGAAGDQGNAVAYASGRAYVAGMTSSSSLTGVTPSNAYSGGGDAFIAKVNPAATTPATSIVWLRYLGGSLADSANGIAVDSAGDVYVTGSTVSSDFPVTNAFQKTFGGGNADAFVTKVAPTGASLLYSSYLGGTNTDVGNAIAVDSNDSAYVAGQTCSVDFPLAHPLQAASGGNCDAFISKVSTQGGIVLNPAGLVFSAQSIGTASQPETVTLTNQDSSAVTIASGAVTIVGANAADFAETDDCQNTSLATGASCTISVTFDPTGTGTRTAQIQVTDSASNSPQLIGLSGTSATLALNTAQLTFQDQVVGTTSPAQTVTVANEGTTSVTFTSITASSAFAEVDDCTKAPIPAGTNCTINVTFTPTSAGTATGALLLNDNAPGSPQEILLTGTGIQQPSGASLQISPLNLPFADQAVGTSSPAMTVTVSNNGTTPVTISGVVASGPFAEADDCTKASLQPAQSGQPYPNCTINVTFSPISAGAASGTLTINDNVAGSPQIVTLSGTGVQSSSSASLLVSPTSLTFPDQTVGTTSTPLTVAATNQGSVDVTISSILASGAFAETDNCTKAPLPPTTNCAISVTFAPLSTGSNVGALTITTSSGGQQLVLLSGNGIAASTGGSTGGGGGGGTTSSFTISAQPTSATVTAGSPAKFTLSVAGISGFSGQVALSCSGLPSGAFCNVSPNPATPGANVALTINTTSRSMLGPVAAEPWTRITPLALWGIFAALWLALLLLFLIAERRQAGFKGRRALAALALAVTVALFSVACGGGTKAGQTLGTPAGNYQVTVTGTSGAASNSTTLSLQVK